MLRKFIALEFEKRKSKNKAYSIRSFARDLKIESSTLSKILKGTRPIKPLTAVKLLENLNIDWAEKNTLLLSVFTPNKQSYQSDDDFTYLGDSAGQVSASWEFYAVLSLAELPDFKDDPVWIANRLGTTSEMALYVLNQLKKLNLVGLVDGRIRPTGIQVTTLPGNMNEIAREAQKECLLRSIHILLSQSSHDVSDYSGVTMAISTDKIPEAIRRIKEFRRSLASFLNESITPNAVYRLGIQLFPFTQLDPKARARQKSRKD